MSAVSFCLSRPSPRGSLWFPSFLRPAGDCFDFFYLENLAVLEFRIVAKAKDTTTGTGKKVLQLSDDGNIFAFLALFALFHKDKHLPLFCSLSSHGH